MWNRQVPITFQSWSETRNPIQNAKHKPVTIFLFFFCYPTSLSLFISLSGSLLRDRVGSLIIFVINVQMDGITWGGASGNEFRRPPLDGDTNHHHRK